MQRSAVGTSLPWLGEAPRRMSASAIMAPPPGPGEIRRTALPETFDGIRFEIGRMIRYVQAARKDPVILANVEAICSQYYRGMEWNARMNGTSIDGVDPRNVCAEAIDAWCRAHYVYVNDPPNIEVIQTPRRMVQMTKVPPEVLREILAPFFWAMEDVAGKAAVDAYELPQICMGDCDEGGTLFAAHCAACPYAVFDAILFDFGGHDKAIHHVWSGLMIGENHIASDLTEPDYKLGDYSRFPHYENVEIPMSGNGSEIQSLANQLGIAELGRQEKKAPVVTEARIRRMAEKVAGYRKDALFVDTARLLGAHYGKMVEHFSLAENRPVAAHNNKTLFLEGIDLWSRRNFNGYSRSYTRSTEDPREVIAHIMQPWYEALEMDDPSRYRMPKQEEKPAYFGSSEDLVCATMGLAACLDITPMSFAFGTENGEPKEMWARIHADGNVYDSCPQHAGAVLGDRPDYEKIEEIEVPL